MPRPEPISHTRSLQRYLDTQPITHTPRTSCETSHLLTHTNSLNRTLVLSLQMSSPMPSESSHGVSSKTPNVAQTALPSRRATDDTARTSCEHTTSTHTHSRPYTHLVAPSAPPRPHTHHAKCFISPNPNAPQNTQANTHTRTAHTRYCTHFLLTHHIYCHAPCNISAPF